MATYGSCGCPECGWRASIIGSVPPVTWECTHCGHLWRMENTRENRVRCTVTGRHNKASVTKDNSPVKPSWYRLYGRGEA